MSPPHVKNIVDGWDDSAPVSGDPKATIPLADVLDALDEARTFWLTVSTARGPHTRPVFAVVDDVHTYVASAGSTVKGQRLQLGEVVSLGAGTGGLDIVVRGSPTRVRGSAELDRVAAEYRTKYGWPVAPDFDAGTLVAPFGAPTAGRPPFYAFRIDARTIHAFGTSDQLGTRSSRWTLADASHRADHTE